MRGKEPLEATFRGALAGAANMSMTIVDFDKNGEMSTLVARYLLTREGHFVEGVMTAVLYERSSSWRIRLHKFDAPKNAEPASGAAPGSSPGSSRSGARVGTVVTR